MSVRTDRRTFLRYAALGGAMACPKTAHSAESGTVPDLRAIWDSPRSEYLRAAEGPPRFELEELTLAGLQERMRSGQETAQTLIEKYLDRIETLDRKGPALRAVLETNPEALALAASLDAERKAGHVRGPLHGIPVLVKDNIDTADRMTTTAGSLALEGSIALSDAFIAAKLRAAGAIILGKTNLSEWANFRSSRSTSGWSGRGGLCRNPYALDRNTSGSSSGTGAGVAASFAAAGVGTETDGSIVSPSNHCSLVGLKPTVGLLSRSGIIPISRTQDTAGPMTRTVRDAAILLTAMAGADPADVATRAAAAHAAADYTAFLDVNGLKGARIGVPRNKLFGYSPWSDQIGEAALGVMKQLGAIVIDPADQGATGHIGEAEMTVMLYEFKAGLNKYLSHLGPNARVQSLADVIRFNADHRSSEMPYFGQEVFEEAEKKGPLTDVAYRNALLHCRRHSRTLGIDQMMRAHRLDALVMPTDSPPWMTDLVNGDHFVGGSSTGPAVAGYPHLTVPGGYAFGLPVGVSFVGRAWSEPTLLRLAYAFEHATKHRHPPTFAPTAEVGRA
jgi:amidase